MEVGGNKVTKAAASHNSLRMKGLDGVWPYNYKFGFIKCIRNHRGAYVDMSDLRNDERLRWANVAS